MTLQEFEEEIQPYFVPVNFKKKEFFLKKGEVCKEIAFIIRGLTSVYTIEENNYKCILAFGLENHWITDRESCFNQKPSKIFIQALEPTSAMIIQRKDFAMLLNKNELFGTMTSRLKEKNAIVNFNKIDSMKRDSAEMKYHKFLDMFPEITQRIPQHMIASYLGIKPETLSRIRKNPRKK